jgi:glycosyltransferase involved in cell wall biosynthesis
MIVIDARYVRERPSGIGAMVQAIVERVPRLMPEESFLLLTHPRANHPISGEPNVQERVVRAEANGPITLALLSQAVDLRGARLFHATYNIMPAGLSMPVVTTIHDVMWLSHPQLCRSPGPWGHVEQAFYGQGLRQALRGSARLIAVSEATRREIGAIAPGAAGRTVVIPHGLDPAFRPAASDEEQAAITRAQQRYAPGSRRFVLTVGQAAGYKNHRGVVEGFLRAFRDDPGTHLVLVQRLGEGARRLLERAREHGADGRVHVLPSVPFADLLSLYRGALCLCHPSIVEGWGMPIGEALGAGCPVVTSDRSAMPEVAGDAALLTDPTDACAIASALRRLATDEPLRASLAARGLRRAAELTWDRHARATAELYRSMLTPR